MQTSGIKIDISSKNLLIENSEKIEKVIKFAVKQAVKNLPNENGEKIVKKSNRSVKK